MLFAGTNFSVCSKEASGNTLAIMGPDISGIPFFEKLKKLGHLITIFNQPLVTYTLFIHSLVFSP